MSVLFDLADKVATITLDRPEQRNALNADMLSKLADAFDRCDTDDDIRAVVITGTPPAFCSGADMTPRDKTFGKVDARRFSAAALARPIWTVRKPVIAAVNGHAVGIGLTIALQCDIRYMARDAKYGVVQARRGVMGDAYSHWTLPRICGTSRAAEILLTGKTFNGDEACELGVCSRVLPNDEVLDAALELARDIAVNTAPLSVAYSKRLLWESTALSYEQVEERETADHHKLMGAPDATEGVLAFLEGREPNWTGSVNRDFH